MDNMGERRMIIFILYGSKVHLSNVSRSAVMCSVSRKNVLVAQNTISLVSGGHVKGECD